MTPEIAGGATLRRAPLLPRRCGLRCAGGRRRRGSGALQARRCAGFWRAPLLRRRCGLRCAGGRRRRGSGALQVRRCAGFWRAPLLRRRCGLRCAGGKAAPRAAPSRRGGVRAFGGRRSCGAAVGCGVPEGKAAPRSGALQARRCAGFWRAPLLRRRCGLRCAGGEGGAAEAAPSGRGGVRAFGGRHSCGAAVGCGVPEGKAAPRKRRPPGAPRRAVRARSRSQGRPGIP